MLLKRIFNILIARPLVSIKLKFCGKKFRLGYSSTVLKPEHISIGDNFFSGPRCYMSANRYAEICILDDVMLGPEVMILAGNHDLSYTSSHMIKNQCDNPTSTNIRIETGAWVGARSIILSGACISEGSVLGAGSLCNNFIPPYVIAVGSPAKKLTKRFLNPLDLKKLLSNVSSEYSFEEIQEVYIKYEIPY